MAVAVPEGVNPNMTAERMRPLAVEASPVEQNRLAREWCLLIAVRNCVGHVDIDAGTVLEERCGWCGTNSDLRVVNDKCICVNAFDIGRTILRYPAEARGGAAVIGAYYSGNISSISVYDVDVYCLLHRC